MNLTIYQKCYFAEHLRTTVLSFSANVSMYNYVLFMHNVLFQVHDYYQN